MARLLLIVLIAVPALAQEATFFIERIEVRNVRRVAPALIMSETLLREGAPYSEEQLAAASARLTRLPFLLSADFALEKGSDRGKHVLVINVVETKPFFFLVDTRPVLREDRGPSRFEYSDDDFGSESKDAALGLRWFVGRRGIVHAGVVSQSDRQAFTRDYSAVAAGYTQYDLFGTRAFVSVNVRFPEGRWAEGTISPQIVAGLPLSANQTLTLEFQDTHFRNDTAVIGGVEIPRRDAERLLSASWTYNTTNHPFAPTRGTILRVTPLLAMRDRTTFGQVLPDANIVAVAQLSNAAGLDVAASHYWELSERNAVSAAMLAGWAGVEQRASTGDESNSSPAYQVVRGTYSRNLWAGEARSGDSRLEFDARFMTRQINFEGPERIGDNDKVYQASVAWVRRSSWGMARIGIGYAWGE